MTNKSDFTAEEWQTIVEAPAAVSMLVILTARSGPMQLFTEMRSLGKFIQETQAGGTSSELLGAVLADLVDEEAAKPLTEAGEDANTLRQRLFGRVRQAAALVDSKAERDQGRDFKYWLQSLSERIAEAAKEGSILGFGGEWVTEDEKETLRRVNDALGLI